MVGPIVRKLPGTGHRGRARFLGGVLIAFSPLPFVLAFISWGSGSFGRMLRPAQLGLVGVLYALLGLVSLTLGIVLTVRYYRSPEAKYSEQSRQREAYEGAEVDVKHTAMARVEPEGEGPNEDLERARNALSDLRVAFAMQRIHRDEYAQRSILVAAEITRLEAELEKASGAEIRRIPDYNRSGRKGRRKVH